VDAAFDPIKHYGRDSAAVLLRLLDVIALVAERTQREDDRRTLLRKAIVIERDSKTALTQPSEQEVVARRVLTLREHLLRLSADAIAERDSEFLMAH
jgi:uncharacterized membrane protein